MERIDENLVRHIATLSRLELRDDEVSRFTEQLAAILDYASHLPAVHEATSFTTMTAQPDESNPLVLADKLLHNAVSIEDGFVKVPAILDKGDA